MYLLGIPDGIDPKTVRVDSTWPMSARSARAFRQMSEREEHARRYSESVPDDVLRTKIAADNEASARRLEELGVTEPQDYDDPETLTREEMIEMISAGYAGAEPDLEVVYPGVEDPMVLTVGQARAMPESAMRERAAEIVENALMHYDPADLAPGFPDDASAIEVMPLGELFDLIGAFTYFFDPAGDHPFPRAQQSH